MCGLHHGTANALTLPVSMDFNATRRPGLYRRVGIALGLGDPSDSATIAFVRSFLEGIGLRPGLRHYGVKPEQFAALSETGAGGLVPSDQSRPCHKEGFAATL